MKNFIFWITSQLFATELYSSKQQQQQQKKDELVPTIKLETSCTPG